MDGNKRDFFKKKGNPKFKRKGDDKRGRWSSSSRGDTSGNIQPGDTVYRVLCPLTKIGGVIGKGGGIVKAMREDSQAKITVADSVPGSEERVIIIYSSPTTKSQDKDSDEDLSKENERELMQPHCAAQDALMRVHNRMVEEDGFDNEASDGDNEDHIVTVRLLVPNNMVGCLLGKGGDVIQRLRSETGATIRVLPAAHLPTCAVDTDELVQISGKPDVAKMALYEVSTLLHQNPRKDKPPSNTPVPYGAQRFHPGPPVTNMIPPGNPVWPHRSPSSHGIPPMALMGRYEGHHPGFAPGSFHELSPRNGREAPVEFCMKLLCSDRKIGGVIGKGGYNVRQLEQDTGASIDATDVIKDSDERVIRISSFEVPWNPRSPTIDAILRLQNQTSDFSEKSIVTTRLLVPSSKVGCILGQGGNIINEMRRRTQADIRVHPKEDKPKCASEDEELVQISGNPNVAREALAEIASRLRARSSRELNAGAEPIPVGPGHRFGPPQNFPSGGFPPAGTIEGVNLPGYDPFKGGRYEYEHPRYPVPPAATRYPTINNAYERRIPNNEAGPVVGSRGSNISKISEAAKLQDTQPGSAQNTAPPLQGSYQDMIAQYGSYPSANQPQSAYQNASSQQEAYQNANIQQEAYANTNAHYGAYPSVDAQQNPYSQQMTNIDTQQSSYQNTGAQPGAYQY